ncbi:hypothetical protein IW140_000415 [Coemansia sp. RSA 1813]|nr:hypothetical protein EV178_000626 [Coemansia sp. RSA 1646]KAJ1773286.1 hypothetical protein LPJ74_000797 [Coemansia sp. RSA 1843]KAJ2092754.1 hypothetical protein IW138_000849 [Coemansia sp. RSA 986]KAJ2217747.1 hypothetical protein EV179_000232 [Coemansia sp. RSA 487]KAJ2573016.1 hypothetical protein IW140_000415 [Coemansia sp. RSA 1813]
MSAHDANKEAEQAQQDPQSLSGFLDLDMSNNPTSPNAFGNFPFPLSDQASLFNFHAPIGLGADPMYSQTTHGFFGSDQPTHMANPAAPDDVSVDLALLGSIAGADPLTYATASSLLYARSMAGSAPDISVSLAHNGTSAQGMAGPTVAPLQQQQQVPSQNTAAQMTTRVRAARARILNNVLYNMSLGGIQQLDGYNHGSLAVTASMAQGVEDIPATSQSSGMNRFLADAGASASLGIPSGHIASIAESEMAGYSMPQPDISEYTMGSATISPTNIAMAHNYRTGIPGAPSSSAATAPSTAPLPRIEQACKMCRRRKVRCDGQRPSCTFCLNKRFECVYEPVAPGGRKRGRRSKTSDAGSVVSSNAVSDGPQAAARSTSDADDYGFAKNGKQPRLGRRGTLSQSTAYRTLPELAESPGASDLDSPDVSDLDSGESSADDDNPKHNYLEALSNRQIALPDSVDTGIKLQDIMDTRADIELAEGVAAAALASIANSPHSAEMSSNQTQSIDAAATAAAAHANTASSEPRVTGTQLEGSKDQVAAPSSLAERHMQLYFTYFHPQHPILHRHTFEKSVRNGTVNKVLWHAVQAIAARYGPPPPSQSSLASQKQQVPDSAAADSNANTEDTQPAVDEGAGDAMMDVDDVPESPKEQPTVRRQKRAKRLQPKEFGRVYAELVRAMLPEATRTPTIDVIQALYLLSEHQFGMGDWLEGSTYWGTAVRMFNQMQLHMTDEAFQFPAYTSHLGLHESAVSPLTCKQSPANYASEMRKPTLNNESWIRREMERRMRWVLFESERMHSLAGGSPPLVTLEAGWVHMPCSDALWELSAPRRAAEYERLLLHMGRYYVDTGGSLRIDMAPDAASIASSQAATAPPSANELSADEGSDLEKTHAKLAPSATDDQSTSNSGNSANPRESRSTTVDASTTNATIAGNDQEMGASSQNTRRRTYPGPTPNRVASMLVSIRRRKNRIHLNAHTAIVIGQMTRARLALFRLFFPCRWPSQLMASSGFSAHLTPSDRADLGGGGGAPGPVVLGWDERFRRMRITISDIEAKLMQWRVYLESMFPLREHEEGSGRTDDENDAIHRERVEYANYRFLLSALIIQNRSTVLQLQACLARRERKIRHADQEPTMGETARQTLANHILPNQPSEKAMRSLRAYGQECWMAIVRQACEIEDLLESHWQVRPHSNQNLHVMVKPDWHAPNAIKAKINAETNLRRFPEDPSSGQRPVGEDVKVYFSHEAPPYPLLVVNQRMLEAIVKSANKAEKQIGAELTLASSMNSNIHIETNANARDMGTDTLLGFGARQRAQRKSRVLSGVSATDTTSIADAATGGRKRGRSGKRGPRIPMTEAGEVDFESTDDSDADEVAMDPFRRQQVGTSYFIFLAAKTMIMYLHHAKMSAYILARRKTTAGSESGDSVLPSSSISVEDDSAAAEYAAAGYAREGSAGVQERQSEADALLMPEFTEDLQPPPQLKTLSDIRRMQDRLEVVMTALRHSQKYWMGVDYFELCARKLRNMSVYGPWRAADPVSSDISAELVNEEWPQHVRLSEDFSSNVVFGT